jgi:hypothetical protein
MLSLFIAALVSHWLFSFGGVVLVIIAVIERLRKKDTEAWVFWGAALVCLFIACYGAWVDEHNNAQAAMYGDRGKAEAWSMYNQCDKDRAVNDALAKSYQNRNNSEQDLFDKCILSLGNANKPERLQFKAQWVLPSLQNVETKRYLAVIVGATNKQTSVNVYVRCDKDFQYLDAKIAGINSLMNRGSKSVTETEAIVDADIGTWSPDHPLVIFATSNTFDPHTCTIVQR